MIVSYERTTNYNFFLRQITLNCLQYLKLGIWGLNEAITFAEFTRKRE